MSIRRKPRGDTSPELSPFYSNPNDAPENVAVWQMPRRQSERRARVSLKLKMVLGNHLREISLCSRSLVF
jgi:hypothetical protein